MCLSYVEVCLVSTGTPKTVWLQKDIYEVAFYGICCCASVRAFF